ncbi:hypothetical protein KUL156_26710 [Alteromonas sp. KUL156]|nr:hypothetical protein KUL154_24370 [Alteromonas sp. KUL154]GFE00079.1 hypothetical protein KUL156_26710 [Alteromonas sp. KUL156]
MLTALCGCGYKGALYIPEAPKQNTSADPASSNTLETDAASGDNNTSPATTPGEQN